MVKKVARQNNDLLKYHEKDYIIILNDFDIKFVVLQPFKYPYKYRDIFLRNESYN